MGVTVVTAPVAVVSYAEAKAQIRSDNDAERSLVEGYIAAAVQWMDGPEGWLGRSLGEQTLELSTDCLTDRRLPFGPVIDVVSVSYADSAGTEHTIPDSSYELVEGCLHAPNWPATSGRPGSVRIRYRAGYSDVVTPANGETPEVRVSTVPAPIRQAMLLLVGHWFRNRETIVTGTIATSLPFSVEALLSPYRRWVP